MTPRGGSPFFHGANAVIFYSENVRIEESSLDGRKTLGRDGESSILITCVVY